MGFGQRLSALGRVGLSRGGVSKDLCVNKGGREGSMGGSETSAGGEGSMESLGSLGLDGLNFGNFPVALSDCMGHQACYISVDSTRHGSRLVGNEISTVVACETRLGRTSVRVCDQSMFDNGEWDESDEVHDVTIVASTFARTMRARERMCEATNVRTSVDCVLDEYVLTMDRENIFPELSYLTGPMMGRWETRLDVSDPLDPLFKACGINYVKRFVVDKLALQIELSCSEDKKYFQLELMIPFGNRVMKWDLHGENYQDNDPDCGLWDGHVNIVKVDLKTVAPAGSKAYDMMQEIVQELGESAKTEIYAPIQTRTHKSIGVVQETRFSVPSKKYGKLLFLKYTLFPKNKGKQINVVRCLSPIPKEE